MKPTRVLHVYFAQAGAGGPIKIGRAFDVDRRVAVLQTGCPVALSLLAFAPATEFDETALHYRFAADRVRAEWFSPSAALLAMIEEVIRSGSLPALKPAVAFRAITPESRSTLDVIESFLAETGMSPTAFGIAACRDPKFCHDLRRGRRLWPETEKKARDFMRERLRTAGIRA